MSDDYPAASETGQRYMVAGNHADACRWADLRGWPSIGIDTWRDGHGKSVRYVRELVALTGLRGVEVFITPDYLRTDEWPHFQQLSSLREFKTVLLHPPPRKSLT